MEPLAYLHIAEDFEDPTTRELSSLPDISLLVLLNELKCPSKLTIALLGVLSGMWVLTLAGAASASEDDHLARSYAGGGYFYIFDLDYDHHHGSDADYRPVGPAPVAPSTCLQKGDSGPDVRCLQDRLRELGYFTGPSTGYFGSMTKAAVIAFQCDYGLVGDGVAGPETLAALSRATRG